MFAVYAVMFTIRPKEIMMAGLLPELHLKNYPMIGLVRCVGRRRVNLLQNSQMDRKKNVIPNTPKANEES